MTFGDPDRLVDLLPTIYRTRDVEQGEPLTDLLRVIAEQVEVVDEDIGRLYENWFIETCQNWVVPYIGDLIGYEAASPLAPGVSTAEWERELPAVFPRRDVAHTIADRRRKGTLALLEGLAADASGWPARAVQLYHLLVYAQSLDHLRLGQGRTVDVRRGDALDRVDGPFDELAHLPAVTRIGARRRRGRYNIPNVGLYLWRLRPYSISEAPAFCIDRARNHYLFNLLAIDTPLITEPVTDAAVSQIAGETDVPDWIRRRALDARTADYYGTGKSIIIWRDNRTKRVPLGDIVAADLSDWSYRPCGDQVAVDPVLGRIAFPPDNTPERGVWVTYHYGFSADIGGGEYSRPLSPTFGRTVYRVGADADHETIMAAIHAWQMDRDDDPAKASAIVEIVDSGVYEEPLEIELRSGDRLELRAAQHRRPLIRLLDWRSNRPDALRIRAIESHDQDGSDDCCTPEDLPQIVFDGLVVIGRDVWITGCFACVAVRHCTFVPGWSLEHDCEPRADEPGLVMDRACGQLNVEHSILGSIRIGGRHRAEPVSVSISDSIVDATRTSAPAIAGLDGAYAPIELSVARTTVLGELRVRQIRLVENAIFTGAVRVARTGVGCIRFCYVPEGSRTSARHHCQPDLVKEAVSDAVRRHELDPADAQRAMRSEVERVRPQFESVRYGKPEYCRLALGSAPEIARGADDESELGVFHDLFQPQREQTLSLRLQRSVPAGSDAALIYVT